MNGVDTPKVGNPPGWWKISVSLKNLKKLDEIKQKLEAEKNERLSYNKVIQHLIEQYLKKIGRASCRERV